MSPRDVVRAIVFAPIRFLDWVYAPDTRGGPTRGQAIVHLHTSSAGHDSSRWMQIEEDERRSRKQELRRLQDRSTPGDHVGSD